MLPPSIRHSRAGGTQLHRNQVESHAFAEDDEKGGRMPEEGNDCDTYWFHFDRIKAADKRLCT
jgi:hypothetical protein